MLFPSLIDSPGILFATDCCDLSRRTLLYVKKLALQARTAVRSVHVIDLTRTAEANQQSFTQARHSAERMLREVRRELRLAGIRESATLIAAGEPAEAIREMAAQRGFALLVMGVCGAGARDPSQLGHTTRMLLEAAPCPVLTVSARCPEIPPPGPFRHSFFVSDETPASLRAAREASGMTEDFATAPKYAVLAPGQRELANGFARVFRPIRIVEYEHAAERILAEAARAEMMVVARRADGYLNSFAPQGLSYVLVTAAPCPVLWVREGEAQG